MNSKYDWSSSEINYLLHLEGDKRASFIHLMKVKGDYLGAKISPQDMLGYFGSLFLVQIAFGGGIPPSFLFPIEYTNCFLSCKSIPSFETANDDDLQTAFANREVFVIRSNNGKSQYSNSTRLDTIGTIDRFGYIFRVWFSDKNEANKFCIEFTDWLLLNQIIDRSNDVLVML